MEDSSLAPICYSDYHTYHSLFENLKRLSNQIVQLFLDQPTILKGLKNPNQVVLPYGPQHIGDLYLVIEWLARELTGSPRGIGRKHLLITGLGVLTGEALLFHYLSSIARIYVGRNFFFEGLDDSYDLLFFPNLEKGPLMIVIGATGSIY